ncbi:MAG: metalloregulator ArsR/SmtB family transcription factor [Candidatus Gastranaerophilales bacterium]|nr:metalloregulator ArsR/SmtB family transcription factor [Candidatus Gastranaerophilales bacterium]
MDNNVYLKKAEIFKALSNPVRIEIIDTLLDGEKCVCEIVKKLKKYEQPHISKSLAKLKSVGIIKMRKDGLNVYYSLKLGCISEFIGCLNSLFNK